MLTIKIIQDTFFKQSTAASETLSLSQKQLVNKGREFKIKSYFKQGRHYFVKLAESIAPFGNGKTGFFFEEHIQVEEIRGVWITNIDTDILQSKDNIKRDLQKLKDLGFNTLYPVVWNKGFAFFESSLVNNTLNSNAEKLSSVNLGSELAGRDILKEIIEVNQEAAHGFRIIPWFEYGLMLLPNSPLAENKPEWLMVTKDNKKEVNEKYWLNPSRPEVQEFLTGLIREVVKNYDIDGIQLDDHFGIPISMSFDTFTKNLFEKETGAANPSDNPNSQKFKEWRKNQVTQLLRLIFNTVKEEKDDCIVSLSPNPLGFSVDNFLADWQAWEQEEIIEELVIQIYRYRESFDENMTAFKGEINKPEVKSARQHIPTLIGIITGLRPKDRRVALNLIQSQTEATRERDFAGFSYFFFGSLFDLGFLGDSPDTPEKRANTFAEILSTDQFV